MALSSIYQPLVERACNTELENEESRKTAVTEIIGAINERKLLLVDLAVGLAVPLTSPEKDAREHGTRLLGEVVLRCRDVLNVGELHTLAEFLAARLKDWPCVGAAAAACRALLQRPSGYGSGSGPNPELGEEGGLLIMRALEEMLRSAQSFRQEERCALLQLLLAALQEEGGSGGSWGRLAVTRGSVALLDAFLGAADGEKDPRCLLLAFEAVTALCRLYHSPGVDPTPLRQLADELADWAASYFPIAFNPPPHLTRGSRAITRAQLASGLESALAASPFLAGGVLPLLVEKLSSTYKPAKQDALCALRRCCPAFGADALGPHVGQLWTALRAEIMAPAAAAAGAVAPGGGLSLGAGAGAGGEGESAVGLAAEAAGCLTVVVRAAGPGGVEALALQDAFVGDLVEVVRNAVTRGSGVAARSADAVVRADGQVLCGALLLGAIAAAGPSALQRTHAAVLRPLQCVLHESLTAGEVYDKHDQTLYGIAVLAAVVDAVAKKLAAGGGGGGGEWIAAVAAVASTGDTGGVNNLLEIREALAGALVAVHRRLHSDDATANERNGGNGGDDVSMIAAETEALPPPPSQPQAASGCCYNASAASQLRLAVANAWRALARLHAAIAVAVPNSSARQQPRHLTLSEAQLAAAAEQLCACALQTAEAATAAGPSGAGGAPATAVKSRMSWGRQVDLQQEAAGVLQLLLQLAAPLPAVAAAAAAETAAPSSCGGGGAGDGESPTAVVPSTPGPAVVTLLVSKLAAAMGQQRTAATDGDGDAEGTAAAARATAALRLAAQLAAPAEAVAVAEAASGAIAFTAALLDALPPLLLGRRGGPADEAWVRECLSLLSRRVLPALAGRAPAEPQPSTATTTAAAAAAAASHRLVTATLAAAAEWEAAAEEVGSNAGLPFRGSAGGDGDAAATAWCTTTDAAAATAAAAGPGSWSLMACWCGVVQQLVACCEERQQLALVLESADRIAACSASTSCSDSSSGLLPTASRSFRASLPLACAVVTGLRPRLLATHSSQALADSLLRLLAAAAMNRAANSGCAVALLPDQHAVCTASVALAATVNRWQDATALDAWLTSAFQPALLQPLAAAAAAVGATGWSTATSAAVRAVGWIGRALALRNHPTMLPDILRTLSQCLRVQEDGAILPGVASAVTSAALADGGGAAMDVDTAGPAATAAAAAASAAALAAAESFGVLVAEEAGCGGLVLAGRPAVAVCRVLWQQRTYALCLQVLCGVAAEASAAQQQQQQQPAALSGCAPLPLSLAVAVSALTGAAPRPLCRQDAPRLAPLLLRSVQRLGQELSRSSSSSGSRSAAAVVTVGSAGATANTGAVAAAEAVVAAAVTPLGSEGPVAATAVSALRNCMAVLHDWIRQQKVAPSEQLGRVLQDNVSDLVRCICTAASTAAPTAHSRGHLAGAADPWVAPQQQSASTAAAAAAVAVREEAMRCCTDLMDAVPYHVLHPLRQQVLGCIVRALDDNRRSVRQLAVRARRVWADK